jgi:hypothetical protein
MKKKPALQQFRNECSYQKPTKNDIAGTVLPLQKKIEGQYQTSVNNKNAENVKHDRSDVHKSLSDLVRTKFYGRKFDAEKYWEEFEQSDRDGKTSKLKEILTSLGFLIKEKNDKYTDFVLSGTNESFVKIIDESFDEMDAYEFERKFQEKGILISFGEIGADVKNITENCINIENDDIKAIIFGLKYLPIEENTVAKIMYGDSRSEIVTVKKTDSAKNSANVESVFSKEKFNVALSSLKELKDGKSIANNIDEFTSLITYLNELGEFDILEEIEKGVGIEIFSTSTDSTIRGNVDGRIININLKKRKFQTKTDEKDRVLEEMIDCSGIHWSEIASKRQICYHMGLIFYQSWINKFEPKYMGYESEWKNADKRTRIIGKDGQFVTESAVLKFLRELYFRLKLLPMLMSNTTTEVELAKQFLTKDEQQRILHEL